MREGVVEEVRIDVRDVDYTWFEDVKVYLDRDFDLYHLPRESADRPGEPDEETGDFFLVDGQVEAKSDEIEVDGEAIPVWTVGCSQLIVRRAARSRA
jgi:hypothetical protein